MNHTEKAVKRCVNAMNTPEMDKASKEPALCKGVSHRLIRQLNMEENHRKWKDIFTFVEN